MTLTDLQISDLSMHAWCGKILVCLIISSMCIFSIAGGNLLKPLSRGCFRFRFPETSEALR